MAATDTAAIRLFKTSDSDKRVGINMLKSATSNDYTLYVNGTLGVESGVRLNKVFAPTSSGGTTYGTGNNGQVLKSNGTTIYWASDSNTNTWRNIKVNDTQEIGSGTGTGALNIKNGNGITVSYNSGVIIDHSNSITAQTTQAVYPIKIDAQGHISAYGSAQTILSLGTSSTTAAAGNHAHGNITNGGDITATAPTIASGDQIIINDNSASKITNGPTFDGSTATKCLTQKGTWESFTNNAGTITGSGTSGYLTKFNGTSSITNGPQLGSDTTTFLRNDGTWQIPPINGTYIYGGGLPDDGTYTYIGDWGLYLFVAQPSGYSLTSAIIPGSLVKSWGGEMPILVSDEANYTSGWIYWNGSGMHIRWRSGNYVTWYIYGMQSYGI